MHLQHFYCNIKKNNFNPHIKYLSIIVNTHIMTKIINWERIYYYGSLYK